MTFYLISLAFFEDEAVNHELKSGVEEVPPVPIATAATEAVVSSSNTTISQDNVGDTDVPVSTTEKKDIVHPNDRLLRILREHSVKKKLPSVAFWDREYEVSSKDLEASSSIGSSGL